MRSDGFLDEPLTSSPPRKGGGAANAPLVVGAFRQTGDARRMGTWTRGLAEVRVWAT